MSTRLDSTRLMGGYWLMECNLRPEYGLRTTTNESSKRMETSGSVRNVGIRIGGYYI